MSIADTTRPTVPERWVEKVGRSIKGSDTPHRKGFIPRIPHTQRYQLTAEGRRLAVFFTKTYTRIVDPSLAELDPSLPSEIAERSPLAKSWRAFEHALDQRITEASITA